MCSLVLLALVLHPQLRLKQTDRQTDREREREGRAEMVVGGRRVKSDSQVCVCLCVCVAEVCSS